MRCLFASDLHGSRSRYLKLLRLVGEERPGAVFLGGDLLPMRPGGAASAGDFDLDHLERELAALRAAMGDTFPRVFLIFGNDDERIHEAAAQVMQRAGLLDYVHRRAAVLDRYTVYGYSCIPPSPFLLKDWERYDVSRYVDPGCVSPEEGRLSVAMSEQERRYATIRDDLERLQSGAPMESAIFLFHVPPYRTRLDRAALDGLRVDGVPLDVHVGSIAVRRFIETRQPLLTLHGHVHESARLTLSWQDRIGRTLLFSAAHDGEELSVVRFDTERLREATRELV